MDYFVDKKGNGLEVYYYDLYIPIGVACRPAYHLCVNDLRNEAYPLDWQKDYSLKTVLHLFETKFDDFFAYIEEVEDEIVRNDRTIIDVNNKITSIHHFPKDVDVKSAQKEFLQKMRLRYQKMHERLEKVKKILLISNREEGIDELGVFLDKFSALFPNLEIKYINIRNNESLSSDLWIKNTYRISDTLSIDEYEFNDSFNSITSEPFTWRGNEKLWRKILENYYNKINVKKMSDIKDVSESVVIYGAGRKCRELIYKLEKYNISIKGIAVTEPLLNPKTIGSYYVNILESYEKTHFVIISLEDKNEVKKIKERLFLEGYNNLGVLNRNLCIEII